MQSTVQSSTISSHTLNDACFLGNRSWRHMIILFIFLVAVGIRIYGIGEPMLGFHPTRNYRSAIIARQMYYAGDNRVPEWRKKVVKAAAGQMIEPPIMEMAAVAFYRVARAEHLWIPRVLSVAIWCLGGLFVYRIARLFSTPDAAVFALAYFLLLPFGIVATRGFMPDPLMVTLMAASVYAMLLYHAQGGLRRLCVSILISALAVLVKPHCASILVMGFLGLSVANWGPRGAWNRSTFSFLVLSILPATAFYGWALLAHSMEYAAEANIVPQNLLHFYYWKGWLLMVRDTVGYPAVLGAVVGIHLTKDKLAKHLLVGLAIGYIAYGLVFTGGIWSHTYYHLPAILLVALAVTPLANCILGSLRVTCRSRLREATLLLAALLVMLFSSLTSLDRLRDPYPQRIVQLARGIGRATKHTTRGVFLSGCYTLPIMYYGEVAGMWWPLSNDLFLGERRHKNRMSAGERLNRIADSLGAEFFVITDVEDYRRQPQLVELLTDEPVVEYTDTHIIFDIR